MLLHARPAQIQVAVAEPRFLGDRPLVGDRERRPLGVVQQPHLGRHDLDLARVQLRVHRVRAAAVDRADDADDHLGAELLGLVDERLVVADDDLRDAIAVAHVDEEDGAHVADAVDPSEQDGRLADGGGPQRAAGVGTTKVSEWLHCV